MLDAPFASLEADYHATLARRDREQPQSAQAASPRVVLGAASRAYKVLISPLFTGCCRFQPSCSDYMREAVVTHGAVRGTWLGLRRLARCHPFGAFGHDPCPPAVRTPDPSPVTSFMERRVFIAVILSVLVLYGCQASVRCRPRRRRAGEDAGTGPDCHRRQSTDGSRHRRHTAPQRRRPGSAGRCSQSTASRQSARSSSRPLRPGRPDQPRRPRAALAAEGLPRRGGEPVDLVPSNVPADQPTPFSLRVDDRADHHAAQRRALSRHRRHSGTRRRDARAGDGRLRVPGRRRSARRARSSASTRATTSSRCPSTCRNGATAAEPGDRLGAGLGDIGATSGGGSFFTGNYVQPPQAIYPPRRTTSSG